MVGMYTDMLSTDTAPVADDIYTTLPLAAVRPGYQRADEEELHASFEDAISVRLSAVHQRLNAISNGRLHTPHRSSGTNDSIPVAGVRANADSGVDFATMFMTALRPVTRWQRRVRSLGYALLLLTLGFDLMGLLIITLR